MSALDFHASCPTSCSAAVFFAPLGQETEYKAFEIPFGGPTCLYQLLYASSCSSLPTPPIVQLKKEAMNAGCAVTFANAGSGSFRRVVVAWAHSSFQPTDMNVLVKMIRFWMSMVQWIHEASNTKVFDCKILHTSGEE
ncbi:hypothetical protein OQA88_3130 [Cercophora sp. LCS_1]